MIINTLYDEYQKLDKGINDTDFNKGFASAYLDCIIYIQKNTDNNLIGYIDTEIISYNQLKEYNFNDGLYHSDYFIGKVKGLEKIKNLYFTP